MFFQDGFVEAALRSITEPEARLLDAPADRAESFALLEAVQESAPSFGAPLDRLRRIIQEDGVGSMALSGALHAAAMAVVSRSAALLVRSRRLPAVRSQTRRELIRRLHVARDFIRTNFDRHLNLTDIAREACLSSFHFHRTFRTFFGETPHQFVIRLRLDCAAERLRRSDSSITEIAVAVGFESATHFSRAFKHRFDVAPQLYREGFRC